MNSVVGEVRSMNKTIIALCFVGFTGITLSAAAEEHPLDSKTAGQASVKLLPGASRIDAESGQRSILGIDDEWYALESPYAFRFDVTGKTPGEIVTNHASRSYILGAEYQWFLIPTSVKLETKRLIAHRDTVDESVLKGDILIAWSDLSQNGT